MRLNLGKAWHDEEKMAMYLEMWNGRKENDSTNLKDLCITTFNSYNLKVIKNGLKDL